MEPILAGCVVGVHFTEVSKDGDAGFKGFVLQADNLVAEEMVEDEGFGGEGQAEESGVRLVLFPSAG